MKQFLTLCLAAATAGGTFTANADSSITLEQAHQLHKEGKAPKTILPVRDRNSLKRVPKTNAASRFHKMINENGNGSMRAPQKVTPRGANIFGFLVMKKAKTP